MTVAVVWRVVVKGSPVGSNHSPGWRNWQTRRTQNPLAVRSCGFKSRPGHEGRAGRSVFDPGNGRFGETVVLRRLVDMLPEVLKPF